MSIKKHCLSLICALMCVPLEVGAQNVRLTDTYQPRARAAINTKASEYRHYFQVQQYLANNDYAGLKRAAENGLNLNAQNRTGDTSVCTAVKSKKLQSFNMLQALGADVAPECMKKIDTAQKRNFIRNYTNRGGFISLAEQDKMLVSGTNWLLVGGVAGGVALAGGATALALSGGGGGSGGEAEAPAPTYYPTNPEYYVTSEFSSSNFSSADDFLGQIKAQYAYAYAAQNASVTGSKVAGEGIIIGELDSGIDVSHSELSSQILTDSNGQKMGINFHYGPCRNGDRTNCWLVDSSAMTATIYNASSEAAATTSIDGAKLDIWNQYEALFPSDWDWNAHIYESVVYGDSSTHGTHVAGIMTASKNDAGMHGVAFNSKVVGASIPLTGWFYLNSNVYSSYDYLVQAGASVINNSWGNSVYLTSDFDQNVATFDAVFENSLKLALTNYAKPNSVISVFAAGNDGNSHQAGISAAAPMAIPSLLYYRDTDNTLKAYTSYPSDTSQIVSSLFVAVVSVNSDNELAYYSQTCGAAARWCIAAPGGEQYSLTSGGIVSTVASFVNSSGYERYQGTSMASPVVTSSLAVIMAAFPSLSPQEAVAILFESATDLGAAGVDSTYGHGLVNLQAAMQPLGATSLATGASVLQGVAFNNARISLPRSFSNNLNLPENVMILDKYNRGFGISSKNLIASTHHSKQAFANDLRLFTKGVNRQKVHFSDRLSFQFSDNKSAFDDDALSGSAFSLTYHNEDKMALTFSFSGDTKSTATSYFEKDLINPFTTSGKNVWALENRFLLAKNLSFSLSGSVGENNFFDGNERLEERNEDTMETLGMALSWSPVSKISVDFTSGLLSEDSSTLGLWGRGAFETAGSQTYFTGVEVKAKPFEKWQIGASYYRGYSKGGKQNAFVSLSDLVSESFGFNTSYQVLPTTQIGARIASPLRIIKGQMNLNVPVSRDAEQDIVYRENVSADLGTSAQEWNFGLYAQKQTERLNLQSEVMARVHPDNDSAAKPDYRLLFSLGFNY